jgi:4-amino-4-deoxy-L-arabinose transferase-like glycosyltransferase
VFAVGTLLTNAYYLRFLEPVVSRRLLATMLLGSVGLLFFIAHVGLPRARSDMLVVARRLAVLAALVAILAAGFSLRLSGINSGLPQSYVADEYDFVHAEITMIKRSDFNPYWWHYPSLKTYLNMGMYTAVYLAGARSGRWHSVNEITVEDMLYWGRFVAVVFGTAAMLLTFFLARRLFGTRVGLMAAALLAVFPSAVAQSQINKPDGMLAFMTTLSVLASLVYFEKGRGNLAVVNGLAIGLAMGTKYNGVLVALPFLVAVWLRHGRRFLVELDLYAGVGGAMVGFFATSPFLITDFARFLDHISWPLYGYGAGQEGGTGVDNWYHHARYAAIFGTGILALLAALGGLALALYRLDARLAVALTFPVIYASVASSQMVNWAGLIIPVYPFIAILAAYGIDEAAMATSRWRRAEWLEPILLAAMLVLALWFPTRTSILHDREANLPDTGNVARKWINETFEPGTHFVAERHTPVPDRARFQVSQEARAIYRSVADYRSAGVQYVIVSSQIYNRYGPEHRVTRAYQTLFELCPTVAEFEPVEGELQGPTIRVLRIPPEGSEGSERAPESDAPPDSPLTD